MSSTKRKMRVVETEAQPANDPRLEGEFPVVIIGGGFGGIGMGIELKKAGIHSFVIIERAGEVGGTWRDNTYPGCACDVASDVYSFSFEPNPNWSRAYSPAAEIQQYILHCTEKYGIRPHLKLNTSVNAASFDESTGLWSVQTSAGETLRARAVVSAVGGLVEPSYPKIKGLDKFEGPTLHTARWDHKVKLAGKRVAVIGTGASAIQVIPAIAPEVKKLKVFQRSAAWVLPKPDRTISPAQKALYRLLPGTQKLSRLGLYWLAEATAPMVILDTPLSRLPEAYGRRHIAMHIKDPGLRRKLTPDYRIGCKRILLSSDYYPAMARDNVELITDGIKEITANGVRTADGKLHEVDVIILATGFKLDIGRAPFPITGVAGRTLDEAWKDGATAYKGISVSGIPNWFTVLGPNTGPGHTSVLIYSEAQFQHAIEAIAHMRKRKLKYVTVKQHIQDQYNRSLQRRMKATTWKSGCTSWYIDENGINRTLYPGYVSEYVLRARHFVPSDYEQVR